MATTIKGLTPIGRVSYPKLVTPDTFGGKQSYSLMLVFDPNDPATKPGLDRMVSEMNQAIKEKWGDKLPKLKKPFKKGEEEFPGREEFAGKILLTLRTAATNKVGIIGPAKEELRPEAIYPGCFARASYSVGVYELPENKGVSFFLNNVQFARDGERLGGGPASADEEFEALAEVGTDKMF